MAAAPRFPPAPPGRFPAGPDQAIETHISRVWLEGSRAWKLKKPVDFGFVDFRSLDARRLACEAELRLNRRLAPDLYLGVHPVTDDPGGLCVAGDGPVVDWALCMERLPEGASFRDRIDTLEPSEVRAVGARLARFHANCARGPDIAGFAAPAAVAQLVHDNLAAARAQAGALIHPDVLDRLHARVELALVELGPELAARASLAVDGHGDLRLEHVWWLPGEPDPIRVVDCVEFSDALRACDPVSDTAFLAMDLAFHGRSDLVAALWEGYGDGQGASAALRRFYASYRSAVRAKVHGLTLPSSKDPERSRLRAIGHWLRALERLAPPSERPGLVLVGGLPGVGKSSVAAALSEAAGLRLLRSDALRKERLGLAPTRSLAAAVDTGAYTPAARDAVYAALAEEVAQRLFAGERVCVDATFVDPEHRARLLDGARARGVEGLLLWCEAPVEVVAQRLAARQGDASDADLGVHLALRARLRPDHPRLARRTVVIDTAGPREAALAAAIRALVAAGLQDGATLPP